MNSDSAYTAFSCFATHLVRSQRNDSFLLETRNPKPETRNPKPETNNYLPIQLLFSLNPLV